MSFDEYQAQRLREEDARNATRQIEIYRVAAQIFTLLRASYGPHITTVPGNRDEMYEAVREAIELWEKVEEWLINTNANH